MFFYIAYTDIARTSRKIVQSWKDKVKGKFSGGKSQPAEKVMRMDEDSSSGDAPIDELADAIDDTKPLPIPTGDLSTKAKTVKTHPTKFRKTGLEAPSTTKRTKLAILIFFFLF